MQQQHFLNFVIKMIVIKTSIFRAHIFNVLASKANVLEATTLS